MRAALLLACASLALAAPALGQTMRPKLLEKVAFDQRLGQALPLDAAFRDHDGGTLRLGDLFTDGKPVILTFAYADCPMLCSVVLQGIAQSLKTLAWTAGDEFRLVTVDIDPKDGPEKAAEMRERALGQYGREVSPEAWRFLVGEDAEVRRVADAVGFRYEYDAKNDQYAHAAGIVLVTPDGRVSRYLYGFEFAGRDLRLALVESSEGKVGTLTDQLLLLCFHWDPSTGTYGAATMAALRVAGAATVLGLGGFMLTMIRRENRS